LVVGVFSLDERVRRFSDLNVLIEAGADERLRREIERNERERGVKREETVKRFSEVLNPTYERHIREAGRFADIVVDNSDWKKRKILKMTFSRTIRARL